MLFIILSKKLNWTNMESKSETAFSILAFCNLDFASLRTNHTDRE